MLVLCKALTQETFDISKSCNSKQWSGDKQRAPRTLSFNFLRTNEVDIDKGDTIIYQVEGKELFQGTVWKRTTNQDLRQITAYDMMFYWANNKDSFTLKNMSLSDIFQELGKRFEIPLGEIARTSYKIPEMNESNILLYDVIKKAMGATYQGTGERYFVRAHGGKVHLIKRVEQSFNWLIEVGNNIIDYSFEDSAENLKTQIKLVSKDDKTTLIATGQNDEMKNRYGTLLDLVEPNGKFNQGQLQELANTTINNLSKETNTLNINCLGLNDIITGSSVTVKIPKLSISRNYYVDSDSHTFKDDDINHTMSLKLVENYDL